MLLLHLVKMCSVAEAWGSMTFYQERKRVLWLNHERGNYEVQRCSAPGLPSGWFTRVFSSRVCRITLCPSLFALPHCEVEAISVCEVLFDCCLSLDAKCCKVQVVVRLWSASVLRDWYHPAPEVQGNSLNRRADKLQVQMYSSKFE